MSKHKTSPCYLILSDGISATVLEKDLYNAKIRSSDEFLVHTNNDTLTSPSEKTLLQETPPILNILDNMGIDAFLKDSKERSACVQKKWNALKSRQKRKQQAQLEEDELIRSSVREETLIRWVKKYPTMNEQSHFGCVMDPKRGEIRWLERGRCWICEESLMMDEDEGEVVDISD